MAVDFAELERQFYADDESAVTPEILGKIIAAVWKRAHSDDRLFYSFDELNRAVVSALPSAPPEIANMIQVEVRPDGLVVDEITRIIVGAQNSGFLVRANPEKVYSHVKADLMQAYTLADNYELEFPEVVRWAEAMVKGDVGEVAA